jgi:hypothetical protein
VFEEGSLGARLTIVVLVTVGATAAVWYQGRLWNDKFRFEIRAWHGAVFGLIGGVFVAFVSLD